MRFLVDECAGPTLAQWLREQSFDVFSVFDEVRGMDDDDIIEKAFIENRILVTTDKDFGETSFGTKRAKRWREQRPHRGVVLLRLAQDERAANKIEVVKRLLEATASFSSSR